MSATVTPLRPRVGSEDRILRLDEVLLRVGISRSTVYRYMARGDFPPARDLGGHAVGWHESAIDRWMATRPPRAYGRVQRAANR